MQRGLLPLCNSPQGEEDKVLGRGTAADRKHVDVVCRSKTHRSRKADLRWHGEGNLHFGATRPEIARKGKLGPNYEPQNNLAARLNLIQVKGRALLAKERGVPVEDVLWGHGSWHDFRRTYGTRMSRVVPMHVLAAYMGHAKIATTQTFYLAAETEDAERAREAMAKLFGGDAPRQ